MSAHDVGNAKASANLHRATFVTTSFMLLAVDKVLHQDVDSRLTDAWDLFQCLKVMSTLLSNDAD